MPILKYKIKMYIYLCSMFYSIKYRYLHILTYSFDNPKWKITLGLWRIQQNSENSLGMKKKSLAKRSEERKKYL